MSKQLRNLAQNHPEMLSPDEIRRLTEWYDDKMERQNFWKKFYQPPAGIILGILGLILVLGALMSYLVSCGDKRKAEDRQEFLQCIDEHPDWTKCECALLTDVPDRDWCEQEEEEEEEEDK